MKDNIWERFWSKVDVRTPDVCWEWKANLGKGYGMFWFGHTAIVAHRVSWTLLRGPIPKDKLVLHKCDNRKCVNPNHLFIGTQSDNVNDMLQKGRGGDYRNSTTIDFSYSNGAINNLLSQGMSLRSIAKKFNTTHSTLIRAMKDGRIKVI